MIDWKDMPVILVDNSVIGGYYPNNPVGHRAVVKNGLFGHDMWIDVVWDKPSKDQDGGYLKCRFETAGGPW